MIQSKFVVDAGEGFAQTVVNVTIPNANPESVEEGRKQAARHVASKNGVKVKACLKKTRLAFLEVSK
ncbi:MAG TPA: hypothetical protein VMB05_14560 [Solirubrobacteraceae bacterium]|nr:hypothetical protein [Solirubrobacteraceae bacterium]